MVTPRWVRTKCQPIAIRDVLHYLAAVLDDPETVDRVLEIGGPDVVTYAEMMQTYAEVAGLPRRIILPVPFLSPRLSSRWVGLVTPLPASIAVPLIDSLRHEVVMTDHQIDSLVPHQPLGVPRVARARAATHPRRGDRHAVDRRRVHAGRHHSRRSRLGRRLALRGPPDGRHAPRRPRRCTSAFARIGGEHGYYVSNWAWSLRGLADKLVGGPGLRRGRRHPVDLRPGEALDFWRVVDAEPGLQLVLAGRDEVARQGVADVADRTRRRRQARCGFTKWRTSLRRACSGASTGTRCCRFTRSSSAAWRTRSPTRRARRVRLGARTFSIIRA